MHVIYCIILSSVSYSKNVLLLLSVQMTSATENTIIDHTRSHRENITVHHSVLGISPIQTLQCSTLHGGLLVMGEHSGLMLIDSKKCFLFESVREP